MEKILKTVIICFKLLGCTKSGTERNNASRNEKSWYFY